MQARAAVMPERHGRWTIETLEVAEPGPQEVLVRVVASGICQTDVHARDGFFPIPCPAVYGMKVPAWLSRWGVPSRRSSPGTMCSWRTHRAAPVRSVARASRRTAATHPSSSRAAIARMAPRSASAGARSPSTARSSSSPRLPASQLPWRAIRSGCRTMCARHLAAFPCGVNTGAGAVMRAQAAAR